MKVETKKTLTYALYIAGAILTFLLVLVLTSMVIQSYENAPEIKEMGEKTLIYSLHDTSTYLGSFTLGCGYIRETMKYTLYVEVKDGGIKLQEIPTDRTVIFQDTEVDPYLLKIDNWLVTKTGEVVERYYKFGYPKYELHVPQGTIIQHYVLNSI